MDQVELVEELEYIKHSIKLETQLLDQMVLLVLLVLVSQAAQVVLVDLARGVYNEKRYFKLPW